MFEVSEQSKLINGDKSNNSSPWPLEGVRELAEVMQIYVSLWRKVCELYEPMHLAKLIELKIQAFHSV